MIKVMSDGGFGFFVRTHEPHHEEERHHCGHEIGVRDFPRATVMAVSAAFLLFDYDD
jgi:hypothetical protein